VQTYGRGRAVFLATDETWRWRSGSGEKTFQRFWGQLIYQMALPHLTGTSRRVQLMLERPENVVGRPAAIFARAFDAEFRPYEAERLTGRLEPLDAPAEGARAVAFEPVAGQPGEYRALVANDAPGRFVMTLDDPAPAALEFRVELPPEHELGVAGMAEEALREAAAAAGGAFYREEDLPGLAAAIVPRSAPFVQRHETLLWNTPMLLVFVGLISLEWLLRKFANLS
jgi:hypothetical protein